MSISYTLDFSEMLPQKRECVKIANNIPRELLNELLKEASGETFNGFVEVNDEEAPSSQVEIKSAQDVRKEIHRLQREIVNNREKESSDDSFHVEEK